MIDLEKGPEKAPAVAKVPAQGIYTPPSSLQVPRSKTDKSVTFSAPHSDRPPPSSPRRMASPSPIKAAAPPAPRVKAAVLPTPPVPAPAVSKAHTSTSHAAPTAHTAPAPARNHEATAHTSGSGNPAPTARMGIPSGSGSGSTRQHAPSGNAVNKVQVAVNANTTNSSDIVVTGARDISKLGLADIPASWEFKVHIIGFESRFWFRAQKGWDSLRRALLSIYSDEDPEHRYCSVGAEMFWY